nr:unnamed protein product [Callosobruchus chinensis]
MRCGNVYTRIDNFRRHQKYVCGMQPQFHCPLCNYSTKYKYVLTTHMKTKHTDLPLFEQIMSE